MKTAKLIMYSAIINLIGLITATTIFVLVFNNVIPSINIVIVVVIAFFLFMVTSLMIVTSIKERIFLMKYDELIALINENDKSWQKALKMIDVLGYHEAIKLYKEKYPSKI